MARIEVRTVLLVQPDAAFALILRTGTFLHVAAPLLGVRGGTAALPERWAPDQDLDLRLTSLGLPSVRHRLRVMDVDPAARAIRTRESDPLLRRWDHELRVEGAVPGGCSYVDRVEVDAGSLTPLVVRLGTAFFRHRQRRLRALALRGRPPS